MKYFKRYISIIFLFVFFFEFGGYYKILITITHFSQEYFIQKIENGTKEKEQSLFVISGKHDLVWIRAGKEFMYKNEMFDIVRIEKNNSQIYYYCLKDKREKQLIDKYNKSHDLKQKAFVKLKKITFNKYFPNKNNYIVDVILSYFCLKKKISFYKSNIVEIEPPYPKIS